MNTPPAQPAAARADEPIANFSQCHVGIVQHLNALGQLPALIDPAMRARQIAGRTLAFFDEVILEHHAEEERELFPAVLQSATHGEERDRVDGIVARLTAEHRQIEGCWADIKSPLKLVAKGHDAQLDKAAIEQLVSDYRAHAAFEEEVFLPLSQAILGRNANHMAALGLSLHMRHVKPMLGHI